MFEGQHPTTPRGSETARLGSPCPHIVVVGAASRDLDPTDPRGWRLGGSVTYGALVLARMGIPTRAVVGVDAAARDAHELELLRAADVDLHLVDLVRGPVFENIETPRGRVQIAHEASDPIPPDALPGAWVDSPGLLLAPVARELPDGWADRCGNSLVALGWQGLLRDIVPGQRVRQLAPRPEMLVARADLGSVSGEDIGGKGAQLRLLLPRPGQRLAVTAASRGAVLLRRSPSGFRAARVPAVDAAHPVDTTGAGDTFLAVWLAGVLLEQLARPPETSRRALHLAALAASLVVRRRGLAETPDLAALRAAVALSINPTAPRPPDAPG